MKEATTRQLEILAYLETYILKNCRAPSQRELGQHFGFSATAAHDVLHVLEFKGYIKMGTNHRSVIVIKKGGV
jgi:SOS-response transcriptional repressor LexA